MSENDSGVQGVSRIIDLSALSMMRVGVSVTNVLTVIERG